MAAKMHFATTENGRGKPSIRRAIGRLLESPLTPEYQMRSGTAPIGSTLLNAPTEVLCKFARTDHAAKKVAQPPLRQGDRSTVKPWPDQAIRGNAGYAWTCKAVSVGKIDESPPYDFLSTPFPSPVLYDYIDMKKCIEAPISSEKYLPR